MAALRNSAALVGVKELSDALVALNRKLQRHTPGAIKHAGQIIINESKRLVPVDTGALKDSAFVTDPKQSNSGRYTTISIGYGHTSSGKPAQYALIQHENTEYFHTVGQDHYLLEAVQAFGPQVPYIMRDYLYGII